MIKIQKLSEGIGDLSAHFKFDFENAGVMRDGVIYTVKIVPSYDVKQITLIQISLTVMNRMESCLRSNARHGSV